MKKSKFCECCGKEFVPKQKFERTKYCSLRCSGIVMRKNKMLKNLEENKEHYQEIASRKLPETDTYSILKYEKDGVWAEKDDMFLYENANIETCEICGKKFIRRKLGEAKKGQRIFCSKDCYYISKQKHVNLECLNCGNNYTDRERNKLYSQFCCDECEHDYYDKIESGEIKLFSHQGKRTCVNCGKEFYDIRNTSVEFCSVFCKREFINKSALKTVKCKECGKEFDTYNNSEFCSTSCGAIYNPNIKLHVIDRPKYIKIYMKYKDVFPLFQLNVCDTSLVGFADESVFDTSNEFYSAAKSLMLNKQNIL